MAFSSPSSSPFTKEPFPPPLPVSLSQEPRHARHLWGGREGRKGGEEERKKKPIGREYRKGEGERGIREGNKEGRKEGRKKGRKEASQGPSINLFSPPVSFGKKMMAKGKKGVQETAFFLLPLSGGGRKEKEEVPPLLTVEGGGGGEGSTVLGLFLLLLPYLQEEKNLLSSFPSFPVLVTPVFPPPPTPKRCPSFSPHTHTPLFLPVLLLLLLHL